MLLPTIHFQCITDSLDTCIIPIKGAQVVSWFNLATKLLFIYFCLHGHNLYLYISDLFLWTKTSTFNLQCFAAYPISSTIQAWYYPQLLPPYSSITIQHCLCMIASALTIKSFHNTTYHFTFCLCPTRLTHLISPTLCIHWTPARADLILSIIPQSPLPTTNDQYFEATWLTPSPSLPSW